MLVVRNDSRTDAEDVKTGFLQPQEVSLHLRPGVSQSFPLIVSLPADQLEVKMDLSTAGVNITIRSTTKGNPHLFQVDVEAAQCPSKSDQNETGPWSVLIAPRGVSLSVKLEITLVCQCNCTGSCEEDSPDCSGHGALVCGRCECDEPYVGHHCQINSDSLLLQDESLCRSGPDAPVCGGRGQCVAGSCECDAREDPTEAYSGQYCECSNFDCPRHNNRLCGGNGRCECGSCLCHPDWTGEACSCSADTASCLATNQMLCHGRGFCVCGTCRCSPPYSGLTCEDCPSCPSSCQSHAACVECHVFGTGAKTNTCDAECGRLTVKVVETKEELPTETEKLCKMRSHADSCFFYYTVSSLPSGGQSTVARVKEC
ncbi:integrin beta-1 [Kryptolebias marmoratus]|uniref:integrin beta-1 n=1 Tax=Kryptolebias marmoratus TaxID=37003 RepID=UPI0018AC9776|nr:integrin beta-1 [Kryptolebias marmoratus]